MKYKVGDKVRVRKWEDMEKEFELDMDGDINCRGTFVREMREYCGKIYTVVDVYCNCYLLKRLGTWKFTDDMLEPVCNSKIVITTDGKETLARLYEDGKVKKSAKAECSPDDKFDFSFGAKLALERLTKPTPKFKVGDKIIGNKKSIYAITCEGWVGTVTEVNDGRITAIGEGIWEQEERFSELDSDCFDLYEPKYYNGKVVCIKKRGELFAYTVGKIYEFVDGRVKIDSGATLPAKKVESLDEWNSNRNNMAEFIELKE